MNERFEALWNRLRRKVDQAVVFGLVILLAATFGLYWVEQQAREPEKPTVTPPTIPETPLNWPDFRKKFTHPKKLAGAGEVSTLLYFNPFDARSVADKSEKINRLNKKFQSAENAFQAGDLTKAKQLCREIIGEMPQYYQASTMLQKIDELERKKAQETQPTTP